MRKHNKPKTPGAKFATFLVLVQKYLDWKFSGFQPSNVGEVLRDEIIQEMYHMSLNSGLMTKKDLDDSIAYAKKQTQMYKEFEENEKVVSLDVARIRRNLKKKKKPSIH